jgi:hypothetical protein
LITQKTVFFYLCVERPRQKGPNCDADGNNKKVFSRRFSTLDPSHCTTTNVNLVFFTVSVFFEGPETGFSPRDEIFSFVYVRNESAVHCFRLPLMKFHLLVTLEKAAEAYVKGKEFVI